MREKAKERFLKKHGNKCFDCGDKESKLEIHHVIPICKGGRDDEDNQIPLCHKCHAKRGRKPDYGELIKIGVNAEYILMRRDFFEQVNLPPEEVFIIVEQMFLENDRYFER
jgi:hypothetical protein